MKIIFILIFVLLLAIYGKAGETEVSQLKTNVTFPFLGKVHVSSVEQDVFLSLNGKSVPLKLKISRLDDGRFFQALFAREGSQVTVWSPADMERAYLQGGERIVGLPGRPPKITVEKFFERFCQNYPEFLAKATRAELTYIVLARNRIGTREALIFNVYGLDKLEGRVTLPEDEFTMRVRFVFDDEGNLLFMDNTI